jgi:hypothetical protein
VTRVGWGTQKLEVSRSALLPAAGTGKVFGMPSATTRPVAGREKYAPGLTASGPGSARLTIDAFGPAATLQGAARAATEGIGAGALGTSVALTMISCLFGARYG